NRNGKLRELDEVVNDFLHEALHPYIDAHPFERSYGEDDKLYQIDDGVFESIPGVTNLRIKENIMMYGSRTVDGTLLSDYWKENGLPLHLTQGQMQRIYDEIDKMNAIGNDPVKQGHYKITKTNESLNDLINGVGKQQP